MLEDWNQTRAEYQGPATLHGLVEEQARQRPHATALVWEGGSLSYGELEERANALARELAARGVRRGDVVGVLIERSWQQVVGLLGVLKAGAAYLPLDPGHPAQRQDYMLRDAGVRVVVTAEVVAGAAARGREPLGLAADERDLAYVIYTSGSTGRPKGVMIEHRSVVNCLRWLRDLLPTGETQRLLQNTPSTFDPSVWEIFWTLGTGRTLVLAAPDGHGDPDHVVERVEEFGVHIVIFVPSMLGPFLDSVERASPGSCRTLRHVFCGGEALGADLAERCLRLLDVELHNIYGPTEAAIGVSWWRCQEHSTRSRVPIGVPVSNTRLYVLDGSGEPVPAGVVGELYIGGVQVARGYLGRPGLTAERFVPDRWGPDGGRLYRTGDTARWRGDGVLEYVGRQDGQVKVRGNRVELGEVEAALEEEDGVRRAVVVASKREGGELGLAGYVVADGVTGEELRERLRRRLPEYMVPWTVMELDDLPLTASGKVDRGRLPEAVVRATDGYVAPRTAEERVLVAIWEEVLGAERVGVEDSFFELGGDSILSTRMISEARRAGLAIRVRQVFDRQTVAGLAEVAEKVHGWRALRERGPLGGPVPLTPIQRTYLEANPDEPWHANQAVTLRLERTTGERLKRALLALTAHHDALRLRFRKEDGAWAAAYAAEEDGRLLAGRRR